MNKKIVLVVEGVDLDDDHVDEARASVRAALWVQRDEILTVTYTTVGADPVAEAQSLAREIEAKIPGSHVTGWYPDLVGLAQIASRVGVSAEAVRLWSTGQRGIKNFPSPFGRVGAGQKTSPVWRWADVATWLRLNLSLAGDEVFPSRAEVAQIDAALTMPVAGTPAISYKPNSASFEMGPAVTKRIKIAQSQVSVPVLARG